MRSIIAGGSLVVLLVAVGCNIAPHRREKMGGGGTVDNTAMPTVENLVTYLNQNADRLQPGQGVQCDNVVIDVKANGRPVGVTGKMMCQTPRNFRLTAVLFGNPAVDIGSNQDEFWYWISKNEPPYLFHCSYEAMAQGARVPFPFRPDMVVNALGLAHYDPAKNYDLKIVDDKRGHKAIELTEQTLSPQNQSIRKVTVFNYHRVASPDPQVLAHVLKDASGKTICVAKVRTVQPVGSNGPIIPKEVVFRWPAQNLQMMMRLENPYVVAITEAKAATVFTRRNLNYQAFDLATRTLDGASVQRTGGRTSIYRSR